MMLAMLCILAVFAPSFFMVGVGRALFVPLALSVGFAMAASYILALTFVPILYTWSEASITYPLRAGCSQARLPMKSATCCLQAAIRQRA
jgi:Cu/Ag efflux pump CusA